MELGHNVMHGQWDWMRDPEIHSTTWEWDNVSAAEGWKKSHNYEHHTYTNIVGKDRDLGYTLLRLDPDQPWKPFHLAQPLYNVVLAVGFQWGVALYDLELDEARKGRKPWSRVASDVGRLARKAARQIAKDYVAWPLLSGPSAVPALLGNLTANVVRNVWTHTVIFCGHFPDGAETFDFDESDLDGESRGGWYVRQLLGSCNVDGPPVLHLMTGNLSYQIEHHLFPDLPSNRYAEVAPRVRALCERYGLPVRERPAAQAVRAGGAQDPADVAARRRPTAAGEDHATAARARTRRSGWPPSSPAGRRRAAPRRSPAARAGRRARRANASRRPGEPVADRLRVDVERARGRRHVAVRVRARRAASRVARARAAGVMASQRRQARRRRSRARGASSATSARSSRCSSARASVSSPSRPAACSGHARHRPPRRLVRARPRHRRPEHAAAGGAGPPRAAAAARARPDRARPARRRLDGRADRADGHPVHHPQRVAVAERHDRELRRQRPARPLGGALHRGRIARRRRAAAAPPARGAASARSPRAATARARTRPPRRPPGGRCRRRSPPRTRTSARGSSDASAQLRGRPPRHAGADAVGRLQRVERAARAELGAPDRLVDADVGQVDVAPEQVDELAAAPPPRPRGSAARTHPRAAGRTRRPRPAPRR